MRRRATSYDSIPREGRDAVRDALFGGALAIWQPVSGYRVNVDTLLLARFAADCRPRARRLVDLGAGVGALALSYAFLARAARVALVEREPTLSDLVQRNLAEANV